MVVRVVWLNMDYQKTTGNHSGQSKLVELLLGVRSSDGVAQKRVR